MTLHRLWHVATLATLTASVACGKGPSYGSPNAIIAVVDPAIRDTVEPILRASLEREARTTRAEKIFELTVTTPTEIGDFEKWRRLIVVEPYGEGSLVNDLVDPPGRGPVVEEVHDAWARDQTIWVLAAGDPASTVELARAKGDSLYRVIHERFVAWQVDRMWASGRDSALYRAMVDTLGFGIVLPRVYEEAPGSAPESARVFFNRDPRRVVSVSWSPRPAGITPDTVLALRRALAEVAFPDQRIAGAEEGGGSPPDTAEATTPADTARPDGSPRVRRTTLDGRPAVRVQGVWREVDGTSAGVFLAYGVGCGDRLVLLDGDLFAPDRDKYPYVIQLERIFHTFHCAAAGNGER